MEHSNCNTCLSAFFVLCAAFALSEELKHAAASSHLLVTIQAGKDDKEAFKRLSEDSAGLFVTIWYYKRAESPSEWLSEDILEILDKLMHLLDHIRSFIREKITRNKAMRVTYSRADAGKITEYRENPNSAFQKIERQSHMNIDRNPSMYNPPYASPLPSSSSMAPNGYEYGCGGVVPGTRTVTGKTSVGDVTNSTISNVGNSVQKVYQIYQVERLIWHANPEHSKTLCRATECGLTDRRWTSNRLAQVATTAFVRSRRSSADECLLHRQLPMR